MVLCRKMALVVSLLVLAGSALAQEDYEIRLARPHKVGEKFKLVVQADETRGQKVSQEDKVLQNLTRKIKVSLEATLEVLAVDGSGEMTKAAFTVAKMDAVVDGQPIKGLEEGTLITAGWKDGEKVYTIKDETVAKGDAAKLLDLVIPLKEEGKPTSDAAFGTKQRQKVGSSWDVDAETIAKGLTGKSLKLDKENVSGKTTLVEATTVGDVKCLRLKVDVKLQNVGFPLPEGSKTQEATIGVNVDLLLPQDPSQALLEDTTKMNMLMKAQIPTEGKTQTLEMIDNRSSTAKYTPIK